MNSRSAAIAGLAAVLCATAPIAAAQARGQFGDRAGLVSRGRKGGLQAERGSAHGRNITR